MLSARPSTRLTGQPANSIAEASSVTSKTLSQRLLQGLLQGLVSETLAVLTRATALGAQRCGRFRSGPSWRASWYRTGAGQNRALLAQTCKQFIQIAVMQARPRHVVYQHPIIGLGQACKRLKAV